MSGASPVRRVARRATAPVRDYVNQHFEMVKDEIRRSAPEADTGHRAAPSGDPGVDRLAELEVLLAEQHHHQTRVLARLADDVAALDARLAELDRIVRQLAEVVAAPRHD